MTKEDLWNLFKMTGKIDYYLEYKRMIEKKVDILGDNRSKRNSN